MHIEKIETLEVAVVPAPKSGKVEGLTYIKV